MNTENLIQKETKHQNKVINLIASENYPSKAVRDATGSILTCKYAEGYPGKRYYAGCENYDLIEQRAIQYVKKIFGATHANVQPHSGSAANMAVYFSCLKPEDKILGPDIFAGGHLTHGSPVNFSGILYRAYSYSVNPQTGFLDYDKITDLASKIEPKIIICGASAYPRKIDFKKFSQIAKKVSAPLLTDIAHIAGLVAAKLHPTPVGQADFVTFTTQKTLRGPRGGVILTLPKWANKIDQAVFPGLQSGPLMNQIAAKSICFEEAFQPSFKQYQKNILENARILAQTLIETGLKIVTGGTETHLLVVDLRDLKLTGKEVEQVLESTGILVNRENVPGDHLSPLVTSGIRIGTPAMTTRGMAEKEMKKIGQIIAKIIKNLKNKKVILESKKQVYQMARHFPIPD